MKFSIYRYNPEADQKPYMQDYELDLKKTPAAMAVQSPEKRLIFQDPLPKGMR